MRDLKEVKCLKTNNTEGCGLCNATWGDYHRVIEGEDMFFCCNICADIFETMVNKVKESTGWDKIDFVELHGNYREGRHCIARSGEKDFRYYFRTHGDGEFITFKEE